MTYELTTPLNEETVRKLRAGDKVLLSGGIYTGRDAAHRRMVEALGRGEPLPMDIRDQVIYYVGPCPAPEGFPIGACGPTTSYRMDAYAPTLMELGLRGMIGKGLRNEEVIESMKRYGAVYFLATGGAGALIAQRVKTCRVVAYEDLGTEAIHYLEVDRFPMIVAIDSCGGNLFEEGPERYKKEL